MAFIETQPQAPLDKALQGDALKSHILSALRERLSPYKIPQRIHFVAHFPETSSGKILKRELLGLPLL